MPLDIGCLKKDFSMVFAAQEIQGQCLSVQAIQSMLFPESYRPALATILPCIDGRDSVILDVGLNPDCKPEVLVQYGILGSLYAKYVLEIENPTVGLLNIGEEETKGTPAVKAAYELMKEHPGLNFGGNIEGHALFHENMTDVVVCDGFVGNIVLKAGRSISFILQKEINIPIHFLTVLILKILEEPDCRNKCQCCYRTWNFKRKAIMNMILQTRAVVHANLAQKIKEAI